MCTEIAQPCERTNLHGGSPQRERERQGKEINVESYHFLQRDGAVLHVSHAAATLLLLFFFIFTRLYLDFSRVLLNKIFSISFFVITLLKDTLILEF